MGMEAAHTDHVKGATCRTSFRGAGSSGVTQDPDPSASVMAAPHSGHMYAAMAAQNDEVFNKMKAAFQAMKNAAKSGDAALAIPTPSLLEQVAQHLKRQVICKSAVKSLGVEPAHDPAAGAADAGAERLNGSEKTILSAVDTSLRALKCIHSDILVRIVNMRACHCTPVMAA